MEHNELVDMKVALADQVLRGPMAWIGAGWTEYDP